MQDARSSSSPMAPIQAAGQSSVPWDSAHDLRKAAMARSELLASGGSRVSELTDFGENQRAELSSVIHRIESLKRRAAAATARASAADSLARARAAELVVLRHELSNREDQCSRLSAQLGELGSTSSVLALELSEARDGRELAEAMAADLRAEASVAQGKLAALDAMAADERAANAALLAGLMEQLGARERALGELETKLNGEAEAARTELRADFARSLAEEGAQADALLKSSVRAAVQSAAEGARADAEQRLLQVELCGCELDLGDERRHRQADASARAARAEATATAAEVVGGGRSIGALFGGGASRTRTPARLPSAIATEGTRVGGWEQAAEVPDVRAPVVLDSVLLEGWCLKRSRWLRAWRKRWLVLVSEDGGSSHVLLSLREQPRAHGGGAGVLRALATECAPLDSLVTISLAKEGVAGDGSAAGADELTLSVQHALGSELIFKPMQPPEGNSHSATDWQLCLVAAARTLQRRETRMAADLLGNGSMFASPSRPDERLATLAGLTPVPARTQEDSPAREYSRRTQEYSRRTREDSQAPTQPPSLPDSRTSSRTPSRTSSRTSQRDAHAPGAADDAPNNTYSAANTYAHPPGNSYASIHLAARTSGGRGHSRRTPAKPANHTDAASDDLPSSVATPPPSITPLRTLGQTPTTTPTSPRIGAMASAVVSSLRARYRG
mmetsp:Transcript_20314/g.51628  ORF Transcript_20314/g.51628 Transcript_20314/m.51628 type:complete len:680 (+) Transcript_20314:105-2144(+)